MTAHGMTRIRLVVCFLAAAALVSCSRGPGNTGVIPEGPFVRLYADLLIAREERSLRGAAPADSAAQDSLYRAYGVTAGDAALTLERYKAGLSTWKEFHARVTKRLDSLQQEMASKRVHR